MNRMLLLCNIFIQILISNFVFSSDSNEAPWAKVHGFPVSGTERNPDPASIRPDESGRVLLRRDRIPDFTIKLSNILPEGSKQAELMHEIEKYIEEKSKGSVEIIWYLGGVMGDEINVAKKIRLGQLHGAAFTGMGLALIVPPQQIMELPFLFNNYNEVDYVLEKARPTFNKIYEENGYVLLGWGETGFIYFMTKGIALDNLNVIDQIKCWVWADQLMAQEITRSLRLQTRVPLSILEIFTGLQTNLINSYYCSPTAAVSLQLFTQTDYIMIPPITYGEAGLVMYKPYFDKLPKNIQSIFHEAVSAMQEKILDAIREDNRIHLAGMQDRGIKLNYDESLVSEIKKRTHDVYDRLIGDDKVIPEWFYDEIVNYRDEFRTKNPENGNILIPDQ